jgi:hypothetical protein
MHQPLRHETDMGRLTGRLREVEAAAVDVVAPSTAVTFGSAGSVVHLDPDHPVLASDGTYSALPVEFSRTALRQQADRFSIPLKYVDLLADKQPDLLATNLNERSAATNQPTLYRMLRQDTPAGSPCWTVRATLSNGYQAIDNLDVLTAVIRGATSAGIDLGDCHVDCDWTDDRFRMRIAVPQISLLAPELLSDYRTPWGDSGTGFVSAGEIGNAQVGDVLWAGLEIGNSETGGGAASIAPRAFIVKCRNGMVRKADIVRSVHLGGRLEDGPVRWSAETRRRSLALVESRMADAVDSFCSVGYLQGIVAEMAAAKELQVENPVKAMEVAQSRLGFSEDEVEAALSCFIRSGDTSVFGLGQAFTAAAQTVPDGDRQTEMEETFWNIVGEPRLFVGASS